MHIKKRKKRIFWAALVLIAGIGLASFALMGRRSSGEIGQLHGASKSDQAIPVKTIRPTHNELFQVKASHIAIVEPFYQANLRARASGTVLTVAKDINQRVYRGEVLMEIDVPDLRQDVLVKKAELEQRVREVRKASDDVKIAIAQSEVGLANVELRRREVGLAVATRDLRKKRLERYRQLLDEKAIVPDVFDEQERDWKVSVASVDVAEGAVQKAQADQKELDASLSAKKTDILLKESIVEIARQDLRRAEALASYAKVFSPFDGVITRRNVDPGAFVQNATSGNSEALLSVSRLDMVTVVARVPDNEAPFITTDTEVRITIDGHPGVTIEGRVTRFSPTVQNSDRTMRVEVDLYNNGAEAYRELKRQVVTGILTAFSARTILEVIPCIASEFALSEDWQKSPGDPVPIRPLDVASQAPHQPILPGSTGTMELRLSKNAAAYLIPSSAVYSVNGKPYILLVQDGKSVQTPVRIQVDDGSIAKVDIVVSGGRDGVREMTGREEIIAARQIEIGHGRSVAPTPIDWTNDRVAK